MIKKQYSGYITIGRGECDETVNVDNYPISEEIEDHIQQHGNFLSVKYYVCKKECTLKEATKDFIGLLSGIGKSEYCIRYSETTGYLWTDQKLMVGGHDLIAELTSYEGKYLILCVEYNNQPIHQGES